MLTMFGQAAGAADSGDGSIIGVAIIGFIILMVICAIADYISKSKKKSWIFGGQIHEK